MKKKAYYRNMLSWRLEFCPYQACARFALECQRIQQRHQRLSEWRIICETAKNFKSVLLALPRPDLWPLFPYRSSYFKKKKVDNAGLVIVAATTCRSSCGPAVTNKTVKNYDTNFKITSSKLLWVNIYTRIQTNE